MHGRRLNCVCTADTDHYGQWLQCGSGWDISIAEGQGKTDFPLRVFRFCFYFYVLTSFVFNLVSFDVHIDLGGAYVLDVYDVYMATENSDSDGIYSIEHVN